MATRRQFVDMNVGTMATWLPRFVRWLVNDLDGQTGPGWKIIEAYDHGNGTDALRNPANADQGNMDNAAFTENGNFGWQLNSLATNDWIVLQSAHVANAFQVYLRLASATTVQMYLIPLGDWEVGRADSIASPPLFKKSADGATVDIKKVGANGLTDAIPMEGFATPANYIAVADEECLILVFDNGTPESMAFTYVGQLDGARSFMTPADSRPYVICDQPSYSTVSANLSFSRLSPLDSATFCSGLCSLMSAGPTSSPLHWVAGNDGLGGAQGVLPMGAFFNTAGHVHFAGFLRYCGSVLRGVGPVGTLGGMSYLFVNDNAADYAGIGITWDGTTPYPS